MSTPQERARAKDACHEAAHAVAAIALGITVSRVELHTGGGGTCYVDSQTGTAMQHLVCVLAGGFGPPICSSAFHGWEPSSEDLADAAKLIAQIERMPYGYRFLEDSPTARAAKFDASRIVEANAEAVRRTADALFAAGYIKGADLYQLFGMQPKQIQIGPNHANNATPSTFQRISKSGSDEWDAALAALTPNLVAQMRRESCGTLFGEHAGQCYADGSPRFYGFGPYERPTAKERAFWLNWKAAFLEKGRLTAIQFV